MKYIKKLSEQDKKLSVSTISAFVPDEIYDIHAHPYHPSHFPAGEWAFLENAGILGCEEHRNALQRYMPAKKIHGLYFGMPRKTADRDAMNAWVSGEVRQNATALSRSLMVVSPGDGPVKVAEQLRSGVFCGLKVYHCYASRPDTMNASITEYAPEWMWEILHETKGIMMLHIVRDGAMDDADNQKEIRRLCRAYPRAKLILAHIARSFNYRNARNGLQAISDTDNVVVDTSAITEAASFEAAIKALGPKRMLWGSDFAVSEMRGRCITTGNHFFWLHPELIQKDYQPPTANDMTLIGIESLLSLREACEDEGLTKADVEDIFMNNALRVLKPHLPDQSITGAISGPDLWKQARTVISGGTGLLSKRAEMFDPQHWPAYFSRCRGCEVWDTAGKRYIDFAGGIGAVLLGYADEDVTAAVQRRLTAGTYCSLVDPQEVELADMLLQLHPWAGKVRYARGGGEAMAMAVRIARASTGKSGVAFCGYHGWHDWYLAANIDTTGALDGHLLPGLQPKGVPRELAGTSVPFQYNDRDSFEAATDALGDNFAAVVMEPMRSQFPRDNFLERIREKCRQKSAVFVVDEITSGLRYGFPGALSKTGVEPDMVVYAKAMSNGFPFAAVIGREQVMSGAEDSFISSSYWTDGVGTAAALAVLKKMQRFNVQQLVWEKGIKFQQALKEIAGRYPNCAIEIGGLPSSPTLNFQLAENAPAAKTLYIRKMLEKGFLVSSIFYLMYAHEEKHMAALLEALERALGGMEKVIADGTLAEEAGRDTAGTGFARLA
ncbi:aminotransferase class III-fold pyridoxal phosphate-dependent enzyme [Agriterribacter sp.]|uniref:aminotransferase class III-fold pyridoxal phosphate-dependent enzyme n=1 Tax=Agriterribacter sp. TaxID=2821509 RepID=UPI002C51CBEA|nr:aminotransferase class III-fold pyridoxal phosphate-dependent enzyme [Agriterribacter sp.]HRP57862.1 aminotransferase class III-fold pyridoxal phosphate-dependent enzyme [Agriterribacter sp.]